MRILLLESLGDGGIAHYTFNLARALIGRRIDAEIFTARNYELARMAAGIVVHRRMFRLAFAVMRIVPALDRERGIYNLLRRTIKLIEYPLNTVEAVYAAKRRSACLAHIQSINEVELLMVIALRASGVKVVYTVHNARPRHGEFSRLQWRLFKWIYALSDAVIIHTESGKQELLSRFPLETGKVHVIPHGNYAFFAQDRELAVSVAKRAIGVPVSCPTILFFGAIRANKGLDFLLRAMRGVKEGIADPRLLIVGEPVGDYTAYRRIIAAEGIEELIIERLTYVEHEEVAVYFSASDLVVLPYREVTGSGVLKIAYAFGKAVVASKLEGFSEVIEDGRNGHLVPVGDTRCLARRIVELLGDKTKRQAMGELSRRLSTEKYSWQEVARKTSIVYDRITGRVAVCS